MTSAKDIARDLLIPQIKSEKFPSSFLLLCPYSMQAILPALFICGVNSFLLAYESGYCQDYRQWLKADGGIKQEMTVLSPSSWKKLLDLIDEVRSPETPYHQFRREGNIFYPE